MNRIARNRLILALALGAAASAPRCVWRSLPIRDVVSFANVDCANRAFCGNSSSPNYIASPKIQPRFLRETALAADVETLPGDSPTSPFLSPDFPPSLNAPSFNELFGLPDCATGACPFASEPSRSSPPTASPAAPDGAIRSIARVYNAYEETISGVDAALGPTRRRVVEKGSGAFVVDSLGTRYVLTAAHIFRDGQGQISAQSLDGRVFPATLVLASKECDVALLRVDAPLDDVPVLSVSTSWPRQGETVWRAGFGSDETLKEVAGVVKGYVKTDRYATYETLKIDGPARQGDSGGPVYNASGEIVGVVWGTDGVDAYATYCGRVLKTLCDFSPAFAPAPEKNNEIAEERAPSAPASLADETPRPREAQDDKLALQATDAVDQRANVEPSDSRAPCVRVAPSQLRELFNVALTFAAVCAFGYCGFFATKSRRPTQSNR